MDDGVPAEFSRIKKTVMLKMAQAAGIVHLSASMPDAFRQLTHRYMKELLADPARVLSHDDVEAAEVVRAAEGQAEAEGQVFTIPCKTFAALVHATEGRTARTKDVMDRLHVHVEAWLLRFLRRVQRVAAHREHRVVQPKDVDLVWDLMKPVCVLS